VFTIKDVYEVYLRSLQSEAVRNNFFRTVYLPTLSEDERSGSRDALYNKFNDLLKVGVAAKESPSRFVIAASVENPQEAALWVATYAEMAASQAKREVLRGNKSEALVVADNLQQRIDGAVATARKQREDEIVRLKEALRVARSIGLKKPPIISGELSKEVSAGMGGALIYMRGSDALEAEIANLESRASDDPFVQGLRHQQEKQIFYRNLDIEPSVIAVYQQDGVVDQPDKPIKPRKTLIVLLSVFIGVGLGLVVALGRDLWVRRYATGSHATKV
jgi:chain length determinant protein (polysaccharide antigen chain regulator)